jgi:DNA-binding transcriptional LysR family regulator
MNTNAFSSIELRYLRYFVAVAEELSFRRAARRLHITAPALSMQIKHLENILETRLCERSTTKVRLTVTGETLLREARELLRHAQKVVITTRETAQGIQGWLRIGIPGRLSHSFISEAVNAYRRDFPKVDVTLLDLDMEQEQWEAVQNGRIHLGFAYDFQLEQIKNIDRLPVIDVPVRAVMGAQHPLAASGRVALADMVKYPLLSVQRNGSQADGMMAILRQKKLEPKIFKKINSFDAYIAMLIAGEGVSLLPEIRVLLLSPMLALRPVKDNVSGLRMQVYAVWKKTGAPPQVLNFVEILRKAGVSHD